MTSIGFIRSELVALSRGELSPDQVMDSLHAHIEKRLQADRERIAQAIEARIPDPGQGPRTYNREWLSGLRSGMSRAAAIAREAVSGS